MRRLTGAADLLGLLAPLGADAAIVLHSAAAEPTVLARWLAESAAALPGRRVHTLMPMGAAPYAAEPACLSLRLATFLPGVGLRTAMNSGHVHALRHALSEVPRLFERGMLRADAVLLRVSPPDADGQVSLGVAVDYMPAVLAQARCVIAEIDASMPRTCGVSRFAARRIDAFVEGVDGPHAVAAAAADDAELRIARHVASLVEDGAVLQLGVGALPDRVLAELGHMQHLGLHTGIIGEAARALIESGVIDNSRKLVRPGVSVATMALGSQAFYEFLHDNPAVELHPCSFTHGAETLRALPSLCAINSALQVDFAGCVNAEQVGARRISLPGGLPDFAHAAAAAPCGRSIIALRATTSSGVGSSVRSNIVASLPVGQAPTLLPEAVDFVVTEHGIAALRGATGQQRRKALMAIAHPAWCDTAAKS